jgi:hypothetical protein
VDEHRSTTSTTWLTPTTGSFYQRWIQEGDQIGRIFAHWAIVFFGQFFEHYRSSPNFPATFIHKKVAYKFWQKQLDTFWAIFSQTHLVTLKPISFGFFVNGKMMTN